MCDLLVEPAARRFAGHLDHVAVAVVEPAVVEAADAIVLHSAIAERGAAGAAMLAHEVRLAPGVAEQDEVLAEDGDADGIVDTAVAAAAHVLGDLHRQPVAAKDFAGRCSRPHLNHLEFFVVPQGLPPSRIPYARSRAPAPAGRSMAIS